MPSDIANVKLGVCTVTYNSVDLGYTKGGVEVEVETETYKVMVDQFGNTPIKDYITARSCVARVPLAETTLDNLVAVMPGSTLVTDGIDTTKKKVEVTTSISTDLQAVGQKLVLHPIAAGADLNDDFTIPIAGVVGNLNYSYKLDEERIYNVEFVAYPDSTANGLLFVVGDETATA